MAKLFKKQGLKDTIVSVGAGGAANVVIDYAWNALGDSLSSLNDYKNIIKIAGGALVGTMVSGNIARSAAHGVAVVGVSNLIAGLMDTSSNGTSSNGTSGLPHGTIGRVRTGSPYFGKKKSSGFTVGDAFINA